MAPRVTQKNRSELICAVLRSAIFERALLPGMKLPEDSLGERFGASRTLIRQAMERLAAEGLVELRHNRGAEELLRQALGSGADLLGGCPYTDSDPRGHIARVFAMAQDFGVDLDFHLDFDPDTRGRHLDEVAKQTIADGMQGRVTIGHVTKLSMLPPEALHETVALTVLPAGLGDESRVHDLRGTAAEALPTGLCHASRGLRAVRHRALERAPHAPSHLGPCGTPPSASRSSAICEATGALCWKARSDHALKRSSRGRKVWTSSSVQSRRNEPSTRSL